VKVINVCMSLGLVLFLVVSVSCSRESDETAQVEQQVQVEKPVQESAGDVAERTGQDLIAKGKTLFADTNLGTNGKACSTCHAGGENLAGKAATYPKHVETMQKEVGLDEMVNMCIKGGLEGEPLDMESAELKALSAYLGSL